MIAQDVQFLPLPDRGASKFQTGIIHENYSGVSTDRPFEVGPNSVAFLLRFPLPQMGMPYIFGKFRAQRKCPISNIFEQMNF